MIFSVLTSSLRSLSVTALLLSSAVSASAAGMIMPIYGNTAAQFNAAVSAAQRVTLIAVINPDNGPGSKKVSGISGQVSRLIAAKARAAGYISTAYGAVSLAEVTKQVDNYRSWYGANGIYLDEMSDRTNKISYYRSIYSYARGKGMSVIGNPGTFVPVGYAPVADILVTFEDPASRWGGNSQAGWTSGYPITKFAAIVYGASAGSWQSIVDRAVSLRYGWIYVTDGGGSDPFGRAPSFLLTEASYLRSKNATAPK
jgi:hypothetical protein